MDLAFPRQQHRSSGVSQRPLLCLLVDSCVSLPKEHFQVRLDGLELAGYAVVLVCMRRNLTQVSSSSNIKLESAKAFQDLTNNSCGKTWATKLCSSFTLCENEIKSDSHIYSSRLTAEPCLSCFFPFHNLSVQCKTKCQWKTQTAQTPTPELC